MLPAATTTYTKMITYSFNSIGTGLDDVRNLTLKMAAPFLLNGNAYNISGDGAFYKDHLTVLGTPNAFAFLGNAVYC
jgi:hypothetical protein